jgi:hypothetical protein
MAALNPPTGMSDVTDAFMSRPNAMRSLLASLVNQRHEGRVELPVRSGGGGKFAIFAPTDEPYDHVVIVATLNRPRGAQRA